MGNAIPPAVEAIGLVHRYGEHTALDGLSLRIEAGELFALLGPNGSGKTTFFRLLTTLMPVAQGQLNICGFALPRQAAAVRRTLGVVFQHVSCDAKLTVRENLRCQAAMHGLRGSQRESRIAQVANQLGFVDRLNWYFEKLSGGLQRRVDIAKSMLHAPRLLVLDEPSTGLDPAARLDLWHSLMRLRQEHGVTVLLTTHLLEEAEKAQRIGILHAGRLVAEGQPAQLRSQLGQRVLSIQSRQPERIAQWLTDRQLGDRLLEVQQEGEQLRVAGPHVVELIGPLTSDLSESIQALALSEPSLEDVFIARTGHRFWSSDSDPRESGPEVKKSRFSARGSSRAARR